MEQEATLYRQIQRQILQDIYKGTYPYGTKLPYRHCVSSLVSDGIRFGRHLLYWRRMGRYSELREAVHG